LDALPKETPLVVAEEEEEPVPSEPPPAVRIVSVGDLEATGHLVCEECGRILRWPIPAETQRGLADLAISSPEGWEVRMIAVSFTGTCSLCRRKVPGRS
jgi:Fe2+ or Zn2+ uptake regulation protein